MTYAAEILQLRNQVGDTRKRVHVDWVGDNETTVFQMPEDTFPVLDQAGTYIVRVAGSTKVETTDYTLDKETGTLIFVSTPAASAAITIDSSSIHITDAGWLSIINDAIFSLGDDFWKEFVDESLTATVNMMSLDLTSDIPNCIAVYEFQTRSSTAINWSPVETISNWRFDRDNNILYIGSYNAFGAANPIRIRGLKKYTIGTAVGDTIDVQEKFFTILEYASIARYWRWRYKDVVELVSKNTTESTRTPLQELIMLSDRFDRLYETEKAKLKPMKPSWRIPPHKNGGGTP